MRIQVNHKINCPLCNNKIVLELEFELKKILTRTSTILCCDNCFHMFVFSHDEKDLTINIYGASIYIK